MSVEEPAPSVSWREERVPGGDTSVAWLTLSNPHRRNALTLEMYDQLRHACEEIDAASDVRVTVLRGAGGGAFAAGTDIREFRGFTSGTDGVEYERHVGTALDRLVALRMPVIAAVEGPAVGAGIALTACCDIVVCTPDSVFGAPIARTLGNCLAPAVVARLYASLGRGRTLHALLTARLIGAQEAHEAGLVAQIVDAGRLDEHLAELTTRIAGCAPLTLAALKEADRRVISASAPGKADDLYELCYGSGDFREGVSAFLDKRPPEWQGR